MVFEQLFRVNWLERKSHAFFLGFIYALIGIMSARLIFGDFVGLMSIGFASILLIPSLNSLLKLEENIEVRENKFSLRRLFSDHKDIFKVYIFLFLGIFLAYALVSTLIPQSTTQSLFEPQLGNAGISGSGTKSGAFLSLVSNNILVLIICLLLSFVYGAGSILFLTWNASVWGIIFGYFAHQTAISQATHPVLGFWVYIVPYLPHLITEAVAYISAAIVGGVISKAVIREKIGSFKFNHIVTDAFLLMLVAIVLIIVGAVIEAQFF